ncbi:hypothetical protein PW52_08335 [Tamlana sedimentorum]|uniref:DUF418 domain-containing protein n=1 Tax=Neotamlana sedimentorum TaxID=1435349 RepID=A0A0D7WDD5_9FLAO|nr:DUF418 domain-containing protein [Tamlana sedimentorum]KJD35737.1 hypothetical protein PW52_08335 [Tamlana sedimentorum]
MVNNLRHDNTRLQVVDALRGFALFLIFLIHNIQYFGIQFNYQSSCAWLNDLNNFLFRSIFVLFGSKAFQIFSLLFGLTFFIQKRNLEQKGINATKFFLWRFFLLFCFGLFNSMFYYGDILTIFSFVGIFLIPLSQLKNKWILCIAVVLIFHPIEILKLIKSMVIPMDYVKDVFVFTNNGNGVNNILKDGSVLDVINNNLFYGKLSNFKLNFNVGRLSAILAMFLMGLYAGRKWLFALNNAKTILFWKRLLKTSIILSVILFVLYKYDFASFGSDNIQKFIKFILLTVINTSIAFVIVSAFVLLFKIRLGFKLFNQFSFLGRMSLTNYILQSVIGSFIYYGYGLGLYKFVGAVEAIIISVLLTVLLSIFSKYWLTKHLRGPFEALWHKSSWCFFRKFG